MPTVEPPTKTGSSSANGVALPGATDRHGDVPQQRWCAPPAGTCRRWPTAAPSSVTPAALALGQVVDLGDGAVDLVGEVVPVLLPPLGVAVDAFEVVDDLDLGVHGEPEVAEEVERLVVARERRAAHDLAELVAPHGQLAARRDPRILLAEAAGGRVPRGSRTAAVRRRPDAGSAPRTRGRACRSPPAPRAPRAHPRQPRWAAPTTVATLAVTSSPTRPSPRVAACTMRPRS